MSGRETESSTTYGRNLVNRPYRNKSNIFKMTEFYAYIDESGDEGTGGKGTKWFVITALIASQDEATALGSTYHRLKQRIDLSADKVLHWAELSHPRKKAVIEELANSNSTICTVLVDTQHPDIVNTNPKLRGKRLYFYAFRRLVERISWCCDDKSDKVRLYPENKAGIKYEELRGYLDYIQSQPECQIRKDCILGVQPKAKSQSNLLQLADSVCGAIYETVEFKYRVLKTRIYWRLKTSCTDGVIRYSAMVSSSCPTKATRFHSS